MLGAHLHDFKTNYDTKQIYFFAKGKFELEKEGGRDLRAPNTEQKPETENLGKETNLQNKEQSTQQTNKTTKQQKQTNERKQRRKRKATGRKKKKRKAPIYWNCSC